eukprot:GILK01006312.1.p1 GENE.GILK01006312.1~~GILK01006312.1.p1  ORF type:complete len:121 (+),score=16.75 GILK01006312.1:42-404(+)
MALYQVARWTLGSLRPFTRLPTSQVPPSWAAIHQQRRDFSNARGAGRANLDWNDFRGVALLLWEKFPEKSPRKVPHQELRQLITALPEFKGDPTKGKKEQLDEIVEGWYQEWQQFHDDDD